MGTSQSKLPLDFFPYSQSCIHHNNTMILELIQTHEETVYIKQSTEIDKSTSQVVNSMQSHIIPNIPSYDINTDMYCYPASVYTDPPTPWNIDWSNRLINYYSHHYKKGRMMYDGNPAFYIPLNPYGIQGTKGRGLLQKWGPNLNVDVLITIPHPKTKLIHVVLQRYTHKVILYGIPNGICSLSCNTLPNKGAIITLLQSCLGDDYITKFPKMCLGGHPKVLYSGLVNDVRNTDNAWIETNVMHYHLYKDSSDLFTCLSRNPLFEVCPIEQIKIDQMYKPHIDFLKLAVDL